MEIPSGFKIGNKRFAVMTVGTLPPRCKGRVYPTEGLVQLSANHTHAAAETFWHEVTHAILHDMGDPRWANEPFVIAFSKRLAQVVKTAEVA